MTSRMSSGWRRSVGIAAYRWARPAPGSPSGAIAGGSGARRSQGGVGRSAVEVVDDRPTEREGVLVVERLVVGHAGDPGVDARPAQLLGRDVLAGRRLHQRRAAEEDRARAPDDDRLVAHRRDVRAAGGARAHDQGDLGHTGRRQPGLVVEDPAEVVAIGEHVGLERQVGAAAVDQVDAGQPVLEGDLLGAQVLLDGDRVVGPALDRGVVGDDDAGRALDPADPGHDPGARRLVVVHPAGGQRAQLEERGARVEEAVDPLADRQLAPFPVALDRRVVPAGASARDPLLARPEVGDQGRHRLDVRARVRAGGVEPAAEDGHGRMIAVGPRRPTGPDPWCRWARSSPVRQAGYRPRCPPAAGGATAARSAR